MTYPESRRIRVTKRQIIGLYKPLYFDTCQSPPPIICFLNPLVDVNISLQNFHK
uniref:Uncharacterized protein n=1 Tax=Manihot esculenta TaxID=3983 RepID=A0A2C9W9Z1_MANES